jgi:hypothetical protein
MVDKAQGAYQLLIECLLFKEEAWVVNLTHALRGVAQFFIEY